MTVTTINHHRRRFLGTAAMTFAAALIDLAADFAAARAAVPAPNYQITRTLVDETGEAVKLSAFKNASGAGAQVQKNSDAHLRWKFTLDRTVPQGESVLLIQRFSERMPDVSRFNDTTTYYEVIGTVNSGATQIASQPFDDMWCLFRSQDIAQWRTITINAEVKAFRVTPALSAVITNLFYDPKAHGNQPIWYGGEAIQESGAGPARGTRPSVDPRHASVDQELQR